MISKKELATLALYSYNTSKDTNKPKTPGWEPISGQNDDENDFSYGVFRNAQGEIVVAYTGTNQGIHWLANAGNSLGISTNQTNSAALIAASVIRQYGRDRVTFTGHSLGGGLASIMAVWFNRPARVFAPAPF